MSRPVRASAAPAFLFVFVLLFGAGLTPALAQTQARMAGSVTSTDGAPVPGVTVRLEATDEHGATVASDSNKKGRYLFGLIRPGAYRLLVDTHADLVLLRIRGKGLEADEGHSVLWEIDQEVSAEQPPKVSVGPRNQIELDIVVGPKSMTEKARREAEAKATQDAFATGFSRVQAGEFVSALEVLEPLAEKPPDHANTWYLIAFSRERLGKWDEALKAVDRVLDLDPSLAGAHLLRGRILKGQGRIPDAEAEFRKEIERGAEPSVMIDSWIALSTICRDTNRTTEAIAALEQAASADPNRRDVLVELARLYADAGDREKAAATLERAEKAGGMDDTTLLNLAISYVNEKQYEQAERLALRLIEKGSTDANLSLAHSILARCDLSRGNAAQGIVHLEKALSLDPASSLAAENRDILAALKKSRK